MKIKDGGEGLKVERSMWTLKSIGVVVGVSAALAAAGMETLTLDLPAGGVPGSRAFVDVPIGADMLKGGAVGFDLTVTEPLVVSSYVCYFRSGKGWYRTNFEPTDDDVEPNRRYHVKLTTAEVVDVEGEPSGWGQVDLVRFAAYRGTSQASRVTIEALSGETVKREVLFIRGNLGEKDSDSAYVAGMRKAFEALGVSSLAVVEDDVRPETCVGVKLVVLAYEPRLRDATVAEIERFVARGGKLFAAYNVPTAVAKLLAVRPEGCVRLTDGARFAGFAAGKDALTGQPPFAVQNSWMCQRVVPLESAQVAAWWKTAEGRVTDIPGLVVSPNGAYLSHVWLGTNQPDQLAFFAAAVDRLLPGTRAQFEENLKKLERQREAERREIAAMPGKPGERRFIWCHSAWGLGGTNDWDSSCRFVKDQGFTDLIVNLAWGGSAFYPSKVLPRAKEMSSRGDALEACKAACRKHGLKMHVWKVCWNQGSHSPKSFADEQVAAKRVTVRADGSLGEKWNCPSDPRNRELEIAAMTELALDKGVDGIHFDYIRYNDRQVCFCAGCRNRFEARLGRKVANWPQDVRTDPKLAEAWREFRCANITAVVRSVSEKVRKAKAKVEISAAVFPNFEGTADTVGQDWLGWCREGWLDFVCPMDYIRKPRAFAVRVAAQRDALKGLRTKLYPGLAIECSHFHRVGAIVPAREIMSVREAGLDGFVVFHLGEYAKSVLPELRQGPLKE